MDIQKNIQVCCNNTLCTRDHKITLRVDFACENADGSNLFIEAKGFATETYRLKRKLWMHYGPGKLEVWGGSWRNPKLIEIIEPDHV